MRESSRNKQSSGRRFGFWFGVTILIHAEVILLIGVAAYMWLPRDADLARAYAGRNGGPDSIEVGMLDEAAARELLADLEKQDEERKAEDEKEGDHSRKDHCHGVHR